MNVEKKVAETIGKYGLLKKSDKVVVALSGGKDSTSVLYLLKKFGYCVEALTIDLLIGDWSKKNLTNLQEFCHHQDITLHTINLRDELGASMCFFRSNIQQKLKLNNCMICGIIKRWLINKKARELKATKLVTGHNLDDGAETVLMNLLKGNLGMNLNMAPETGVIKDKKFVPRIKPLYFCLNQEVKEYAKLKKFPVLLDPCPCSKEVFRRKIRKQLAQLEKKEPKIKINLVNSFLKLLPKLRKTYKNEQKLNYCTRCGEPSRKNICKMCQLVKVCQS